MSSPIDATPEATPTTTAPVRLLLRADDGSHVVLDSDVRALRRTVVRYAGKLYEYKGYDRVAGVGDVRLYREVTVLDLV